DLAIIEAGKMRMDKAAFGVSGLLGEVLSTFAPLAAKNRLLLHLEDATAGAQLVGDRFRIGQVISNFVGNAVKFTPPGGRVELKAVAAGDGVLFSVSDTGAGIHPAERRKVFEKFYQSKHSALQSGRGGWGLGLSIAQEIVRAHAGDIGVESAGLGKGAKFWFFAPATPGARSLGPASVQALLALGAALLCLALPPAARAQNLPLDDKARYDRSLEEKADGVLLKMLGPNRAKVVVDATVDFTRIEKFQITSAKARDESKDGSATGFAWQNVSAQQAGASDLLPGVPMPKEGPGIPQSYERQSGFVPSFLKRLAVTILLDRSVPVAQGDAIQTLISDLLEIDPNRGDALTLVRADFAPAWKTIWYAP
ncbi:MAG: two-component system, OmpR family, sensor histidine kinase BaeS, partial [Elusimicrobia bacterium]